MKPQSLGLTIQGRTYPIIIGENVLAALINYIPKTTTKIIIIADESLVKQRRALRAVFKEAKREVQEISVTAGEGLKSMDVIYPLYGELLELKADRDALLIALGGGSIGDAVGFVAATYLRGIKWMGIPTTLLAQVDSSVGGKTGINHASGKNLIGAFHQPELVVCELSFLKTLKPREYHSGIGEIIKYSLTYDQKFFNWLSRNLPLILQGEKAPLQKAIHTSLKWKCQAVALDEHDRRGPREVLNFGHTFGHALESATKYEVYQHGEAVLWGMRFAVALSVARGHLDERVAMKISKLLLSVPVPELPAKLQRDVILSFIKHDKKAHGDSVRFVLLTGLGSTISDAKVTKEDLNLAFEMITPKKKVQHERK